MADPVHTRILALLPIFGDDSIAGHEKIQVANNLSFILKSKYGFDAFTDDKLHQINLIYGRRDNIYCFLCTMGKDVVVTVEGQYAGGLFSVFSWELKRVVGLMTAN